MSTAKQKTNPKMRCSAAASGGGLSLPVVDGLPPPKTKTSAMGPRRAAVLIGVHVIMIAHFAHYLVAGTTLSPVEPSETMYSLELGEVNAGFVFFAVALLLTLVFGRFVCGWACHLVAYQDLCGWIMKKLKVRPQPFRSRLLVFVPLGLALYMFVYPTVKRLVLPSEHAFPGFTNRMLTEDFWRTFPGPVFAILSVLICGFAVVYVLGAKGFCTYACPYGGFFGLLDSASVGKILVNDDCAQCGHCTATCTSNVRVHEEVKLYGMVVDPGCMKCLDCVSVCPTNALRFGIARPALLKRTPASDARSRRHDYTLAEEVVLGLVFLGTTLAFRGLYDGPPLLLSVCVGGMTAYVALKLYRLLRDPTVRLQNLRIKTAGRIGRSGWAFAAVTSLWLVFAVHSGFVQWHRAWGRYHFNQTEVSEGDFLSGAWRNKEYSDDHVTEAASAMRSFSIADRWGLVDTVEIKRGLTWLSLLDGDDASAERYIREGIAAARDPEPLRTDLAKILARQGRWDEASEIDTVDAKLGLAQLCMLLNQPARAEGFVREAIALAPDKPHVYEELADVVAARGKWAQAIEATEEAMRLRAPTAMDHFRIAGWFVGANRPAEAVEQYRACIRLEPESSEAYYNLGGLLGRMGRLDEAIELLLRADELSPDDAATQTELGLACAGAGRIEEAIQYFERAVALAPDNPEPKMHLDYLLRSVREAPR